MIIDKLKASIRELSSMSNDDFELLLTCAYQKELLKGKYLLEKGQICNYLYFVENGFLRTFAEGDNSEKNIDFSFDGTFACDITSLKNQKPTQLFIMAEEKSIVTLFDKNSLYQLYDQSKEIEVFCRKVLAKMYLKRDEQLNFYRLKTPKERYLYLLKNKPMFTQRVSLTQLSSYIGVARETLSRIRKNIC